MSSSSSSSSDEGDESSLSADDGDEAANSEREQRRARLRARYAGSDSDAEITALDERRAAESEAASLADVEFFHRTDDDNGDPSFWLGSHCVTRARLYHAMFHFTTYIILHIQVGCWLCVLAF